MKCSLEELFPKISNLCDKFSDGKYVYRAFFDKSIIYIYCYNLINRYFNEASINEHYKYNGDEELIDLLQYLKGDE